ncbi:MAG: extracellular solute-binding protein [Chloroflexi bacterium]|nr:extracellular solute-binding protein [Chloroflexota bacterium]
MKSPLVILATALSALALTACTLPFFPNQALPTVEPSPTGIYAPVVSTPTVDQAQATPSPQETSSASNTLTIWLPPRFNPDTDSPAGKLLRERLKAFMVENPGVLINIRIKAESGPASLLEALTAASAAAPGALPDLVALSNQDLEVAALKGLLTPFDGLTSLPDDPDWYAYARNLGLIQGSTFGLPFSGDALLMVYRTERIPTPPADWAAIMQSSAPVSFPADDPLALMTLALYRSAGGLVIDSQGRPSISAEPLAKVLGLYSEGSQKGAFPTSIQQFETDTQAWEAYREQKAQVAVTWVSRYLNEAPQGSNAILLPPVGATSLTLAEGWLWGIATPHADKRELSAKLAAYLVNSDFLAKWTEAAGLLPTRPAALAAWSNSDMQSILSQVALSAEACPTYDVLGSLASVMKDAALSALKGQGDPAQIAQSAADRLKGP